MVLKLHDGNPGLPVDQSGVVDQSSKGFPISFFTSGGKHVFASCVNVDSVPWVIRARGMQHGALAPLMGPVSGAPEGINN